MGQWICYWVDELNIWVWSNPKIEYRLIKNDKGIHVSQVVQKSLGFVRSKLPSRKSIMNYDLIDVFFDKVLTLDYLIFKG